MIGLIKQLIKSNRYTYLVAKGVRYLFRNGFKATWEKVKVKLGFVKFQLKMPDPNELQYQRDYVFSKDVCFSIVVPLYNTPNEFLRSMIESVMAQTYENWQLCMADGSDELHSDVEKICHEYMEKDKRICYCRLERNLGISGNTNACIAMATGDYIGLFDHDDILHPSALFEVMNAICTQDADFIYTDECTFRKTAKHVYNPNFKPDFAPDTLRAYNYICHFTVFSRALFESLDEGFRSQFDGSQDYDIILRLTEKAKKIIHIPKILYFWRAHKESVAENVGAKPYVIEAAKNAIKEHIDRIGYKGEVFDAVVPSTYRIKYEIKGTPKVSILIPNYEHVEELRTCLESIYSKTTWPNFEIIIIENNSKSSDIFSYYREIEERGDNCRVIKWDGKFNYSAINNFGAKASNGEYLLLLNNDTEVITPEWIEEMLMFAQREDVGAVGAMLYYPDDTVQHAGVIVGLGGVGGHSHRHFKRGDFGYMARLAISQNYSAVTAACIMVRRDIWNQVGGLDEAFEVAFNDVDICMRIRECGYLIIWTPYAELYHYESKSRGFDDLPEKRKRFEGEVIRFKERWKQELADGDPYYNSNLTLDKEDFSIKH